MVTTIDPNRAIQESPLGQRLDKQARERALGLVFDLSSGDINSHIPRDLPRQAIFDALMESQSLNIVIKGQAYQLYSYHSVNSDEAITMLEDCYHSIHDAMIDAASQGIAQSHIPPAKDPSSNTVSPV